MVNVTNGRRSAMKPPTRRPIALPTAIADTEGPVEESTCFGAEVRDLGEAADLGAHCQDEADEHDNEETGADGGVVVDAVDRAVVRSVLGAFWLEPRWAGDGTSSGSVARIEMT